MTYTHLTPNELVMIEAYFKMQQSVITVSKALTRSRQTIYKVYSYFKNGGTAADYFQK